MFEVTFGTPKPIQYTEYFVVNNFVFDLEVCARFAGRYEVSEYDTDRYKDEDAVINAIRTNASEIISKCLNEGWPEKTKKVQDNFKGLEELFDKNIEDYGIKGCSNFFSKSLTSDTEDLLNEAVKAASRPVNNTGYPPVDLQEKSFKEWLDKGMVTCDPSLYVPGNRDEDTLEWICPNCNAKNTGKFCGDCGTQRPI